MQPKYQAAFDELKAIGAPVFERSDHPSRFLLSAEENDDRLWADYWSAYMRVDPEVERIVAEHGLFLEWETPGCLIAYEN